MFRSQTEFEGKVVERPLILLVEDEYLLLADAVDALAKFGFETDAVPSGEQAMELFASGTRPYKALITDVQIAGTLTGWELARQIREKQPAFPIIYLTATAVAEWTLEGVADSVLLCKPFASTQLRAALKSLLAGDIGTEHGSQTDRPHEYRAE